MKTNYCKRWFAFILLAATLVACSESQVTATSTATNILATASPTITPPPPTVTVAPTATAIPLTWEQVSLGQDFQRDTVTAFATDKNDPNVIYAAMKNSGVYKTLDGGLSWQLAHQGLASMQVESLLIDSQNPRILYAGTIGGIFKTEDGGENWYRVGDGTYLLMDMQNNSHLYARDENGIYETTDQGNTWNTVYALKKDCPDEIHSWAIHPRDGNMLFIGGGETCAGVYQSSDEGGTWTLIGLEDKPNLNPLAIGLDEQGNFSIYTCFDAPQVWAESGIYISHDGGVNWSFTHRGCDLLTSDPNNPAIIYSHGGSSLFVTRKGDPWQLVTGSQSKLYSAVHIDHPNGIERIIAGAADVSHGQHPDISIFISSNGGDSWINRNGGIGSARAELKFDPMDNARMYLATYYRGWGGSDCTLYRSLDHGKSWSSIKRGDWCGPVFDAADVLYMMEWNALQMSSNGGEDWLWEEWGNHLLPSYYRGGSESVSANPYFEGLVYDIGNVIYYSTGSGWQKSSGSEGLRDARLFYTDQSKMIYAIGRTHQAYSTDNGKTWQNCGVDVITSRSDSRLALDLQGSHLYLATPGKGVMISTDNCQSWQASNEGLSNLFVNTIAIDPNNPDTIYAGTDGGAYISFNGGETWGQVNDGLFGTTVVYSIAVDKNGNVYASTPNGIYQLAVK